MADGSSGSLLATERTYIEVELSELHRSPTNPRKLPKDPAALRAAVADILATMRPDDGEDRASGIRQPLRIRKRLDAPGYEIVAGERRFTAAGFFGLARVTCELVDLTDEEVVEEQFIENGARVDLTPLEEADALGLLRDRFKLGAEEMAARIGKGVRLVRQRLALLDLVPEARAALAAGKWLLPFALEVAGLTEAGQHEVLAKLAVGEETREGEPVGKMHRYLIKAARRRLVSSGIPLADATLVPSAGACVTCPKRTLAQGALWADNVEADDACTDARCFDEKLEAKAARVLANVRLLGGRVLERAEALKLFPYGERLGDEGRRRVVELDDECDLAVAPENSSALDYVEWKPPTWGEVLGNLGSRVSAATDITGRVHEVVDREVAVVALREVHQEQEAVRKERGKAFYPRFDLARVEREDEPSVMTETPQSFEGKKAKSKAKPAKPPPIATSDADLEEEIDTATDEKLLGLLAECAEGDFGESHWRMLAALVIRNVAAASSEFSRDTCKRRGIERPGSNSDKLLLDLVADADEGTARGIIIELLCRADETGHDDDVRAICARFYEVDRAELREAEAAKRKPAEPEPAKRVKGGPADQVDKLAKKAAKKSAKPTKRHADAELTERVAEELRAAGFTAGADWVEAEAEAAPITIKFIAERVVNWGGLSAKTRADLGLPVDRDPKPEKTPVVLDPPAAHEAITAEAVLALLADGPKAPHEILDAIFEPLQLEAELEDEEKLDEVIKGLCMANKLARDNEKPARFKLPHDVEKLERTVAALIAGAGRTLAQVRLGCRDYSHDEVDAALERMRLAGACKLVGKKWQGVK